MASDNSGRPESNDGVSDITWFGGGCLLSLVLVFVPVLLLIAAGIKNMDNVGLSLGAALVVGLWIGLIKGRNSAFARWVARVTTDRPAGPTAGQQPATSLSGIGCIAVLVAPLLLFGGCIYFLMPDAKEQAEIDQRVALEEAKAKEADRKANPKYYAKVDKWGPPPTEHDVFANLFNQGIRGIKIESVTESGRFVSEGWIIGATYRCTGCYGPVSNWFIFKNGKLVRVADWREFRQ